MKKILLVDDSKITSEPISQDLIHTHGLNVTVINNAGEVEEKLKRENFDAIILDVMMTVPEEWSTVDFKLADNGVATGLVLLSKIRSSYPQMPIVVLSIRSNLPIEENEFVRYLTKPAFIKDISQTLKQLLHI